MIDNDVANECIAKMLEADGIILAFAEPPTLGPGQEPVQGSRKIYLLRNVKPLRHPAGKYLSYSIEDKLVGVPDDCRATGTDVIDVTDVVDIEDETQKNRVVN